MLEKDCGELVRQALVGDQSAWNALVGGLSAVALKVARVYRLGDADARDVCQSTWLAVQLGTLRDTTRLPGWLATMARRQALRILAEQSSRGGLVRARPGACA
jgi:DNA-directed RNA polymerase specialized sigma24 family protein